MGADDYLVKPFSVRELQARVRALFRRVEALSTSAGGPRRDETIERGALRIETGKRRVSIDGAEVALTAREFDLLLHFARHPGQVFNRARLLDQVWGYNHEGYEHTVNSHINRLRAKIERDPPPHGTSSRCGAWATSSPTVSTPAVIPQRRTHGARKAPDTSSDAPDMFRTLYGKLSVALVAIVLAIAVLYAVLTLFATRHHLQVTEQRLNRDLARDLVADRNLVEEGRINESALKRCSTTT